MMDTRPQNPEALDQTVRLHIYRRIADTAEAPTAADTARALARTPSVIEDSYRRLAAGRAIVLAPETVNVWMAHPFSAVPTPYRVRTPGRSYWANCAWDALNIVALLRTDGETAAHCPDCGATLTLTIRAGTLQPTEGVIHFAVSPRRFWENIGYT